MTTRDANLDSLLIKGTAMIVDVRNAITGDATITRTIDGSPTLEFTLLLDKTRKLFTSGLLNDRFTANFNGFDFEVAAIDKKKNTVTITMEDIAVAELRRHNSLYVAPAGSVSRVQFVRTLLESDGCRWIKINVDPSVNEPVAAVQLARGTIQTDTSATGDPNFFNQGSASGAQATGQYTDTTTKALSAGQIAGAAKAAGFTGNDLVIMTAIAFAESSGVPSNTNKQPTATYYGLWQIGSIHTALLATGTWSDPLSNAKMAYSLYQGRGGASSAHRFDDWETYTNGAYKKFLTIAQGGAGHPTDDYKNYTSGLASEASSLEDSWTCFKRIFAEVNWRLYADKGELYVGPDSAFINKDPIVTLREFQGGVNYIDYSFDSGKPTSKLTIDAEVNSWVVQPGSVMAVPDMGLPVTKWLCSSITRSLFSLVTTIEGTSPQAELPEPAGQDLSDYPGDASQGPGTTGSGGASNGAYIWPVTSRKITALFGEDRPGHKHTGLDIATDQGSPVVASRSGVVLQASNTNPTGYGNLVIINHDDGDQTYYAHLSFFECRPGLSVKQGQEIAKSGGKPGTAGAGDATGPHLHFEIRQNGAPTNPIPLLSNAAVGANDSVATPKPGAPIKPGNSNLTTQSDPKHTVTIW